MTNREGGFLITKIKQIGTRRFNQILSRENVKAFNGAQGNIIYVLWNEETGLNESEIAKRTGLAKTTLTNMLAKLAKDELITIKQSCTDKRNLIVKLTPKAKALEEIYQKVSKEVADIYYQGFTETEITAFENYLRRILANLEV